MVLLSFNHGDFDLFEVLQIVSKDLSDPVRSHKDLDKDAAPYFKKAVKFYDNLAKQLVSQGHVLDLFASALDQVFVNWPFNSVMKFASFSLTNMQYAG